MVLDRGRAADLVGPVTSAAFTRMLDVDERRGAVGGLRDAGHLAPDGSDQEALDLSGRGVGTQHLVVAGHGLCAVGLDPQRAGAVEPQPVGRAERRNSCRDRFRVALRTGRIGITGEDEDVPGERRGLRVAIGLVLTDDVPEWVADARVGLVDRERR